MLIATLKQLKTAFFLLMIFTLLTGVIYPLLVTGIAQLIFPWQANGSLIKENNHVVGSALIGQYFNTPDYFWGRPSATLPYPYNAASSQGSNLGPSNPIYLKLLQERVDTLLLYNKTQLIPVDLVTASGSGLDPEISPFAAYYQAPRIAEARQLPLDVLYKLIDAHVKNRALGILGEPTVNVLELNLALNNLRSAHEGATTKSR